MPPPVKYTDEKHERRRAYMTKWRAKLSERQDPNRGRTSAKPDLSKFDEWLRSHGCHKFV